MKQVMFEANDNVETLAAYHLESDSMKAVLRIKYRNASFIVTVPSEAELPSEEELERGIEISDYVDWESVEQPSDDNTFSVSAHVYGKKYTTQEYNMFCRQIVSFYKKGGMDKILSDGFKITDEVVKILGSTQMTVGEEIVNPPVETSDEQVDTVTTGE